LSNGDYRRASFRLTKTGEAARAGADDFIARNGVDFWFGGVHLHNARDSWRWDEKK
jgi:hypothetical protein